MPINWERRSFTKEEFIEAWSTSNSIREVLATLKLNTSGGNSTSIQKVANELGLSSEHFYQSSNRSPSLSLDEILVKDTPIASNAKLRQKLVKAQLKEDKCEHCGITEWMGKPAPLQLDHKNGNSKDNRLTNLRILCMNCHGITETWGGRNTSRVKKIYHCDCGTEMSRTAKTCKTCRVIQKRGNRSEKMVSQTTDELVAGVERYGYSTYSKELKISDNTLRNLLVRRGVSPLPSRKKTNQPLVETFPITQ